MSSSLSLREKSTLEDLRSRAQHLSADVVLPYSPEYLWPLVCDTDMLNQQVGLSPTENRFHPSPFGGSQMYVETKMAGLAQAYEEFPFEWQAGKFFEVERVFHKGLFKYLCFGIQLQPETDNTTRLTLKMDYVAAAPGPLVSAGLQLNLNQFLKVLGQYAEKLKKGLSGPLVYFSESNKAQDKITQLQKTWENLSGDPKQAEALAQWVYLAPERYASRIRPFEVAALYGLVPLDTLRFCLMATRAGYLHARWDMRCPGCKGPKENSEHLAGVSSQAFCPTCVADYAVGFDQNLELTFFPDSGLRKLSETHFCAGSPANTPHLFAQFNFWPQTERLLTLHLPPGQYMMRSLAMENELLLQVAAGGESEWDVSLAGHFEQSSLVLAPEGRLRVHNNKDYFQTLQIESLDWDAQVCSAALVSSLPEFKDFFSDELLAEGTTLPISSQTLWLASLFQNGESVNDPAHLEWLEQAVSDHDGSVWRREAESRLAVFQDPLDALKAALTAFQSLHAVNQFLTEHPLELRLSFHTGPCWVQSREGQLDYHGEALDTLLFLQSHTTPGGISVLPEMLDDPDLKWLLLRSQAQVLEVSLPDSVETQTFYRIEPIGNTVLAGGQV